MNTTSKTLNRFLNIKGSSLQEFSSEEINGEAVKDLKHGSETSVTYNHRDVAQEVTNHVYFNQLPTR